MTPKRALHPFFNLRVGTTALADALEEICEVSRVVRPTFGRIEFLAVEVIDFAPVAGDDEVAFVSVETDPKSVAFESARVTTMAFPGGGFVAKIVGRDVNVRRFLVVLVLIPPAAAAHAVRVIDPQSPPADVER